MFLTIDAGNNISTIYPMVPSKNNGTGLCT